MAGAAELRRRIAIHVCIVIPTAHEFRGGLRVGLTIDNHSRDLVVVRVVAATAFDIGRSRGNVKADRAAIHGIEVARNESDPARRHGARPVPIFAHGIRNIDRVTVSQRTARHRTRLCDDAIMTGETSCRVEAWVPVGQSGAYGQRPTSVGGVRCTRNTTPKERGRNVRRIDIGRSVARKTAMPVNVVRP